MKEVQIDMTPYIPRGHRKSVSRQMLRSITGMNDRRIRSAIEWTAENIEPIFNTGEGYFRWKDEKDIPYVQDYIMRERAKANTLAHRVKLSSQFIAKKNCRHGGSKWLKNSQYLKAFMNHPRI